MNQLLLPNWSSLLVLGLKPARPSKVNSSKMLKLQSCDCVCFVTATPILGQRVSQTHFHVMNLSRSAHGTSTGSGTIRLLHTRHKKFRNTNSKETISNISNINPCTELPSVFNIHLLFSGSPLESTSILLCCAIEVPSRIGAQRAQPAAHRSTNKQPQTKHRSRQSRQWPEFQLRWRP